MCNNKHMARRPRSATPGLSPGALAILDRCAVDSLRRLAGSDNASIRSGVASHPDCPLDALLELAHDLHPHVRQAAVQALPEEYRVLHPVVGVTPAGALAQ